jgi:hypothetical protein
MESSPGWNMERSTESGLSLQGTVVCLSFFTFRFVGFVFLY